MARSGHWRQSRRARREVRRARRAVRVLDCSVPVVVSRGRAVLAIIARRRPIILLFIALLLRGRAVLAIIARRWPIILLAIALLLRGRSILLVIATGRRRRAVSVGRGAIARPIVARRGRRRWTRGGPEEGER